MRAMTWQMLRDEQRVQFVAYPGLLCEVSWEGSIPAVIIDAFESPRQLISAVQGRQSELIADGFSLAAHERSVGGEAARKVERSIRHLAHIQLHQEYGTAGTGPLPVESVGWCAVRELEELWT